MKFTNSDLAYSSKSPSAKLFNYDTFSVHWGQRKLAISEIEFLSLHPTTEENPIVLYAGAAPGHHIPFLSEMFPNYRFVLYDPSDFQIEESESIEIHKDYFTNEVAEKYQDKVTYFLSDIRRDDYKKMTDVALENSIEEDMNMQSSWVKIMNPTFACLKFRLRWPNVAPYLSTQRYLAGKVYWQPWAPPHSSEARLVPKRNKKGEYYDKDWDLQKYDDVCLYHNSVTRMETEYLNPYAYGNELLFDFDSTAEGYILEQYFVNIQKRKPTVEDVIELSQSLSRTCKTGKNETIADSVHGSRHLIQKLALALTNQDLPRIAKWLSSPNFSIDDSQYRWKMVSFTNANRLHNDSGLLIRAAVASGNPSIVKLIMLEPNIKIGTMDSIALQDAIISKKTDIIALLASDPRMKAPKVYITKKEVWSPAYFSSAKQDIYKFTKYYTDLEKEILNDSVFKEKWKRTKNFPEALTLTVLETKNRDYLPTLYESISYSQRLEVAKAFNK